MGKKYIIRNCPALQQTYYCDTHHSKCQDCTNCAMKQIIDRCKDSMDYHSKDMYILGRTNMAGNILTLFEIEEVE